MQFLGKTWETSRFESSGTRATACYSRWLWNKQSCQALLLCAILGMLAIMTGAIVFNWITERQLSKIAPYIVFITLLSIFFYIEVGLTDFQRIPEGWMLFIYYFPAFCSSGTVISFLWACTFGVGIEELNHRMEEIHSMREQLLSEKKWHRTRCSRCLTPLWQWKKTQLCPEAKSCKVFDFADWFPIFLGMQWTWMNLASLWLLFGKVELKRFELCCALPLSPSVKLPTAVLILWSNYSGEAGEWLYSLARSLGGRTTDNGYQQILFWENIAILWKISIYKK